jgi:translation initiation factor 5A
MSWNQQEMRELRVNRYVLVDDEPCRILSIQTSKPGKHGEAKSRVEAIGLFDRQKRSFVHPVTHKVRVPMIDRRKAQVLALMGGDQVQLMDLENYETFELPIDEDHRGKLEPGKEIGYIAAMGKRKLSSP